MKNSCYSYYVYNCRKWPNDIDQELLQQIAVDSIISRKNLFKSFTGLVENEYRVLRRKFVNKNLDSITDWLEYQIDQVIIATMWFCRKGKSFEVIGLRFKVSPERALNFVVNGLILLNKTYDPINNINNKRLIENEEGFYRGKNHMQGIGVIMDYTPVPLCIGGTKFILFLAVNRPGIIQDIELQVYDGTMSEEELFLETSFFSCLYGLPRIQFYCRNNNCFHIPGDEPKLYLSGAGDKKFDNSDFIRKNLIPSYVTAFAQNQNIDKQRKIAFSKNKFNDHFNKFRFPIERICGQIKRCSKFLEMQLNSFEHYQLAASVSGQIYNAKRGHFYKDNHRCTPSCKDFRWPVTVKLCKGVGATNTNYLERVHKCMMEYQCSSKDSEIITFPYSDKIIPYNPPTAQPIL